jgi:hypothetical protein
MTSQDRIVFATQVLFYQGEVFVIQRDGRDIIHK